MSQITPLNDLAFYAFNQLLAGTSIDEIYDNLNIDALLDGAEQVELIVMLREKAGSQGLVIDGGHLRPRTALEAFLNVNAGLLTSTIGAGLQVTLEAGGAEMLIHLSDIPKLIINQVVPAKVSSFLAYVYFTNIGEAV